MISTFADGRYRVERTLGHGGMAVVYLAHDESLQRLVAVKVLAANLGDDETFRTRFLREARLAGRLSHPNIVQVYDAGESDDGRPYIVMEYVAGETVAECGKLQASEAVALVLQACAGLQHAHDAGLVHRDVKPANLLLRDDSVLKIADFGIARAAEATQLTQLGTVLGTAAYLAPEQAAGEEVTAAADIYSLGAVLYELLTGRPPYEFDSLAELAAKQSAGEITPVRDLEPSVPETVEAAVMHSLARDPRFRPASAADFAHELGATEQLHTTAVTEALRTTRRYESIPGYGAWLWIAAAAVACRRRGGGRATRHPGWRQRGEAAGSRANRTARSRRNAGRRGAQPQRLATTALALSGFGGRRCGNFFFRAERDALAGERQLDVLARLVDPPLDGGERDLERVGDLGVRETDDVAQQQRHLQVDVEPLDRAPHSVDRLEPLHRRVDDLERRDVLQRDDGARPALRRAQLVEHAVLRHLEQPGRELRPQRELRQTLVDPEEDFLRQILGERTITDEAEDVVEDGYLVGPDDERKGTLIAFLSPPQDAKIRLLKRQGARV